eukprot:6190389-Pleurochrysis_carterae.AAC.7
MAPNQAKGINPAMPIMPPRSLSQCSQNHFPYALPRTKDVHVRASDGSARGACASDLEVAAPVAWRSACRSAAWRRRFKRLVRIVQPRSISLRLNC